MHCDSAYQFVYVFLLFFSKMLYKLTFVWYFMFINWCEFHRVVLVYAKMMWEKLPNSRIGYKSRRLVLFFCGKVVYYKFVPYVKSVI